MSMAKHFYSLYKGKASAAGVSAGDAIVSVNGQDLPIDFTEDDLFELLVETPRPVGIGFRHQAAN
jgi:hypothetical protein